MLVEYTDFEQWKRDVESDGARVRKVTVSNWNTYYQAIRGPSIVGYFNTQTGKRGSAPEHRPAGNLERQTRSVSIRTLLGAIADHPEEES